LKKNKYSSVSTPPKRATPAHHLYRYQFRSVCRTQMCVGNKNIKEKINSSKKVIYSHAQLHLKLILLKLKKRKKFVCHINKQKRKIGIEQIIEQCNCAVM